MKKDKKQNVAPHLNAEYIHEHYGLDDKSVKESDFQGGTDVMEEVLEVRAAGEVLS